MRNICVYIYICIEILYIYKYIIYIEIWWSMWRSWAQVKETAKTQQGKYWRSKGKLWEHGNVDGEHVENIWEKLRNLGQRWNNSIVSMGKTLGKFWRTNGFGEFTIVRNPAFPTIPTWPTYLRAPTFWVPILRDWDLLDIYGLAGDLSFVRLKCHRPKPRLATF